MKTFFSRADLDLEALTVLCGQKTRGYSMTKDVVRNIPIYDGNTWRNLGKDWRDLKIELADILLHGPGVFAIENFYAEIDIIDEMSRVFTAILEKEKGFGRGDHFGKAGENGRIWNSFQKAALMAPSSFVAYFKNPLIQLVAEAWLGPYYQITTQVNIVRPGGKAQVSHRDYHLGFLKQKQVEFFPLHAQKMSAMLTLQGAVAHSDMPLESGPTKLLPFSQQYELGYLSYHEAEFQKYFEENFVQLPLKKGDAVFFSPALVHAAGANYTEDIDRSVNLFQISSAFGKSMESLNWERICLKSYPTLQQQWQLFGELERSAILCAVSENYPFPTNLDADPPLYGKVPNSSMREILEEALEGAWSKGKFAQALQDHIKRRES